MPGCFVTGTDTGVGKTVLAAAVLAALRAAGIDAGAFKPVITGLSEPTDRDWPPDHQLLARVAGCAPSEVVAACFDPPVSPHLAAELSGRPLDVEMLLAATRRALGERQALIVEGVGGLRVPLAEGWDVRRFACELGLPVLIAARPGLGTINHTLLTLESARAAGLRVAAVVLTPWPAHPDTLAQSNRETIERLGEIRVHVLPAIVRADPRCLAEAGSGLPVADWIGAAEPAPRRGAAPAPRAPDRTR
jgi:dethiobiotin synthetase